MKLQLLVFVIFHLSVFGQEIMYEPQQYYLDVKIPDTIYYPPSDGVQVVEINYRNAKSKNHTNAHTYPSVPQYTIPIPSIDINRPSVFIIRNKIEILKKYNLHSTDSTAYPIKTFEKSVEDIPEGLILKKHHVFVDMDSICIDSNGDYVKNRDDNSAYAYFPRGVFNNFGDTNLPALYNDIVISGKYFVVESNSEFTLLNLQGETVSKSKYKYMVPNSYNSDCFDILTDKGWGVINSVGKEIVKPKKMQRISYPINKRGKRLPLVK